MDRPDRSFAPGRDPEPSPEPPDLLLEVAAVAAVIRAEGRVEQLVAVEDLALVAEEGFEEPPAATADRVPGHIGVDAIDRHDRPRIEIDDAVGDAVAAL